MTDKRFKLQLCSNGIYYVYENGTLTDIDFDKFNKESADALIDEVNALYDENEELKSKLGYEKRQHKHWKKECLECINEIAQLKREIVYLKGDDLE